MSEYCQEISTWIGPRSRWASSSSAIARRILLASFLVYDSYQINLNQGSFLWYLFEKLHFVTREMIKASRKLSVAKELRKNNAARISKLIYSIEGDE